MRIRRLCKRGGPRLATAGPGPFGLWGRLVSGGRGRRRPRTHPPPLPPFTPNSRGPALRVLHPPRMPRRVPPHPWGPRHQACALPGINVAAAPRRRGPGGAWQGVKGNHPTLRHAWAIPGVGRSPGRAQAEPGGRGWRGLLATQSICLRLAAGSAARSHAERSGPGSDDYAISDLPCLGLGRERYPPPRV